jgi:uncharacterized protein (TIGR02147 family)
MPSIFDYTDYRRYLQDYYAWAKAHKRGFSHRSFLSKAGMSGPTYLKRVMEGQHDLTGSSVPKFAKALELLPQQAEFFEALVFFNQAQTLSEKDRYFSRLMELKAPRNTAVLETSQYDYYKNWYNIAIREILAILPYKDNAQEIARQLMPSIQPKQVKKALELLDTLGLVKEGPDGALHASTAVLKTDPSIDSLLIPRFHQTMARLGVEAVERFHKTERYFSGSTLSISPAMYSVIIEKIRALRRELLEAVAADPSPERVYHLNMQLFPLTSGPRKRGRKKKK